MTTCTIEGCDMKVQARSLCFPHYNKLRRSGELVIGIKNWKNFVADFWDRVEISEDCWNWIGFVGNRGYGIFRRGERKYSLAHRYSYELNIGPIPKDLVIDHICRNTKCVNPDHLEAVTQKVNVLRGIAPSAKNNSKTQCSRGHDFTPENTFYRKGNKNERVCQICKRLRDKKFRDKRAAKENL